MQVKRNSPCYHQSSRRRASSSALHASAPGSISREVLSRPQRRKIDESDDRLFYSFPRLVTHVDSSFLSKVTQLYRTTIPPGSTVLDLGSSWISHLPEEVEYKRVIGHGLNGAELAKNSRLDSFFIRDLNKEPDGWEIESGSVDAVVCCVSIQYFQLPERVLAECWKILRPGGVVIISFSDRMFGSKAIDAWSANTSYGRCQLVRSYFQAIEGFERIQVLDQSKISSSRVVKPSTGPFSFFNKIREFFLTSSSDPFFAVIAYKSS